MNQSRRTRDRNADLVLLAIFDFFQKMEKDNSTTAAATTDVTPPPPPPKATTNNVDMTETPSKTKPAAAAGERTSASTAPPLGIRYFFIFFS